LGYFADLWASFKAWVTGGGTTVKITISQADWDDKYGFNTDIFAKAYAAATLDWEGYMTFVEEDNTMKYIFFVKNDLIPKDGTDGVIAAWENDNSMVVGVEVVVK
jgi:hypothetical protein